MSPAPTILTAQHDRALQLSRFIARGATRLGGIDPTQEEYRNQFAGFAGITVIDLSAINAGDRLNHDLFAASPDAVRLIGGRLLQGFLAEARRRDGETAFLEVAADNAPAIALYLAAGFVQAGRRRGYYAGPRGDKTDTQVLSRPLAPAAPIS